MPTLPGRDVLDGNGNLADELIDGDSFGLKRSEHGIAEQRQQDEGERREEEPLHPHLRVQAEQLQRADQEGRQAEEDQVEPARRQQFERGEREPEHQPEPPRHWSAP